MKIRKNVLMLSVIAMLLIPAFAMVQPSFGQLSTMLTVDTVDAPGMAIGELFAINVYVVDVEAMFGYQFDLSYDKTVLMATGVLGSYTPFTELASTNVDTENGVVSIAYSYPSPELVGLYWTGPYQIAWIEFQVVDPAASPFALSNTGISDIHGDPISHVTTDGWFRNLAGAPIAWFAAPEPALGGELVSFTSLSTDPDGTIAAFDWDWGDGTTHGTAAIETHAWATEGTYTVTLTVTDNNGNSDSQSHTMSIIPPPLAGAIAISGRPTHYLLNFTMNGFRNKQWLKAKVKNIDPTREELVRVDFDVWSANYGHVGAVPAKEGFMWMKPGHTITFEGEFDPMRPSWMYVGGRVTEDEFTVNASVYYADFFYNNDPNLPHWAQVPDAPEVSFAFTVIEMAPTPVIAYTYDETTGIISVDGTGSYDPDTQWGDLVQGHRWRLVQYPAGALLEQKFGPTNTFDLTPYGSGTYQIRLRVEDMFGVRVEIRSAKIYFTVP